MTSLEWIAYITAYLIATYLLYRAIRYWRLNNDPELQTEKTELE